MLRVKRALELTAITLWQHVERWHHRQLNVVIELLGVRLLGIVVLTVVEEVVVTSFTVFVSSLLSFDFCW